MGTAGHFVVQQAADWLSAQRWNTTFSAAIYKLYFSQVVERGLLTKHVFSIFSSDN